MVMLAEHYDYVIGGDPDRDTIDLAVIDTATGRTRAHIAEHTDAPATDGSWPGDSDTPRAGGSGR